MTANPDITRGHGEILCTDGGMLSNFPVGIFDPHRRQAAQVVHVRGEAFGPSVAGPGHLGPRR
jgi:hypothetical protein